MSPKSDPQQGQVYAAEDALSWGEDLGTLDELQSYVDSVVHSTPWQRLGFPEMAVRVQDGRGRRSACAEEAWHGGIVRLPRWARRPLIVLHELAHLAAGPEEFHGARFAGIYLALTRQFCGEKTASELEQAFRDQGVEWQLWRPQRPRESRARADVVRLVRELLALSEGTDSPAEAANAAARAQRLLLEHQLAYSDLEAEEDGLTETTDGFRGGKRRVAAWKQMLVDAVARGTLCEWVTNFYGEGPQRTYTFLGRESHVKVAHFLFRSLERQVEEQWQKELRRRQRVGESTRGARRSFCEGVVVGIRERLLAQRTEFADGDASSRELILARGHEAEAFRKARYPHVVFSTRTTWAEGKAHARGRRAAEDVSIQQALGSDGKPRRLLD